MSASVSDAEWCAQVRDDLGAAGVGWPVANRNLTSDQIDDILHIFSQADDRAQGDLRIAATAWTEGYQAAMPYLRTRDAEAFERNVPERTKTQFQLANSALSNICQWSVSGG